jgi:hypothetical protein
VICEASSLIEVLGDHLVYSISCLTVNPALNDALYSSSHDPRRVVKTDNRSRKGHDALSVNLQYSCPQFSGIKFLSFPLDFINHTNFLVGCFLSPPTSISCPPTPNLEFLSTHNTTP